jgi:hypothetical protein
MAKPVLPVTRKLPEGIEARVARDYDAPLNRKTRSGRRTGTRSPAARGRPAPRAFWALLGIDSMPSASMRCRPA